MGLEMSAEPQQGHQLMSGNLSWPYRTWMCRASSSANTLLSLRRQMTE